MNTGNEISKNHFLPEQVYNQSLSFNESVSSNINGYNIDIRSTTRDYIGFGSYLSKGFPFSNWSFRVGGLEKD